MSNNVRKALSFFTAFVMVFAMAIPTFAAETKVDFDKKITIIHTNDVHARVDVEQYVATLAKEKKGNNENVLVLSAGDVLHGQPIATVSEGASIVEIMNAAGYEALAPGNHDFNYGLDRLLALSKEMKFPVLASNVVYKTDGKQVFENYVIKEIDGIKVGIFGLATPETLVKTDPRNVTTVNFLPPVQAANDTVKKLKAEGAQVIIALVHLGIDEETIEANRGNNLALKEQGIDLVVDGHSHTKIDNGKLYGKTLLVQTGSYGENIGVVDIFLKDGKIVDKKASLIENPAESGIAIDEDVKAIIEKVTKENEKTTSVVVGSTPVDLQGERADARTKETNLGDLINDALISATGADVALTNGGNIRTSIPKGDITMGQVLTVLPFGNIIVTKSIKGEDLLAALELGYEAYPEPAGGFAHVAGVKVVINPNMPKGSRITSITMENGEAFDKTKKYTLVTNDFLAAGGDGYEMLTSKENYREYGSMDEMFTSYLKTKPVITEETKGRVVVSEATVAAPAAVAAPAVVAPAAVAPVKQVSDSAIQPLVPAAKFEDLTPSVKWAGIKAEAAKEAEAAKAAEETKVVPRNAAAPELLVPAAKFEELAPSASGAVVKPLVTKEAEESKVTEETKIAPRNAVAPEILVPAAEFGEPAPSVSKAA